MPGSKAYDEIRNKIYEELRRESRDFIENQGAKPTDFSSFYNLLIVIPEEIDCYETMHVLNFFGFPFNIEEDNYFKNVVKKEMGFDKEAPVIYFLLKTILYSIHAF